MRNLMKASLVAAMLLLPTVASAQSLAGTIRDASGGVLPGVTVEATSPALIERLRTTVSDGTGQYRLENLAPGVYSVSYALAGFATVQREAIEVRTGVTVTINVDMRIGGLEETITVTGETPVVDVQNSTRIQAIIDSEIVKALPASRGYGNLMATVPAIQASGSANSGANPVMNFFTARGGRSNEGTVQLDGMNVGSAFNGGGVSSYGYDTANAEEVQITVTGGLGEVDRGGPQFNIIPKTGGNSFSGTYFGSYAGDWSQGDNLDDELRAFGIGDVPAIIKNWDTSFALGGPIVRDRLWFFANVRTFGAHTDLAGLYDNGAAGDPNRWDYQEDRSVRQRSAEDKKIGGGRLTAQVTPRNKVGFFYDYQKVCQGGSYTVDGTDCRGRGDDWVAVGAFGSRSPESTHIWDDREKITQATWSSPVTNQLLLEAGASQFASKWGGQTPSGALDYEPFIPVVEQSVAAGVPVPNFVYHGFQGLGNNQQSHNTWRASAAYVTGTHSLKIGYQASLQKADLWTNRPAHGLEYRVNNGVPNRLTQRIAPWQDGNRTRYDGFYIQDQYTRSRLTLQGALRFEHAWSYFPAGSSGMVIIDQPGDSRWIGQSFTLPEKDGANYKDLAPRMGLAYDVFGDGKTSVKANYSKYWRSASNDDLYTISNPSTTFAENTNRTWIDGNANFIPDCDLTSGSSQDNRAAGGDLCGGWTNSNFGSLASSTTIDPDVLSGWGARPYDWQFGVAVQHELMPRVSAEVSYNRRMWGNFYVTQNRAVSAADYDVLTISAPTHPRLDTSGEPVSYFLLKESGFGKFDNYFTSDEAFGDSTYYWHGVDLTVNARTAAGLTVQGGFSTGGGVRDTCEIEATLPELVGNRTIESCNISEKWLTNFQGLMSYVIPVIDVQVSGILRSQANFGPNGTPASNGNSLNANYTVTNAQVIAALGRPLAGNSQNTSVNLTTPGQLYGDRINNVDFRFAKILRFGGTRTNVGLDLYNLFNANTPTGYNQAFGFDGSSWLRPTGILNPRFVRFNVTFDF